MYKLVNGERKVLMKNLTLLGLVIIILLAGCSSSSKNNTNGSQSVNLPDCASPIEGRTDLQRSQYLLKFAKAIKNARKQTKESPMLQLRFTLASVNFLFWTKKKEVQPGGKHHRLWQRFRCSADQIFLEKRNGRKMLLWALRMFKINDRLYKIFGKKKK